MKNVNVVDGILKIGDNNFPLRNIAQISVRSGFNPKSLGLFCFGLSLIGVLMGIGVSTSNPSGSVCSLITGGVFAVLGLVCFFAVKQTHALIIVTAGETTAVLKSTDIAYLHKLVTAINADIAKLGKG